MPRSVVLVPVLAALAALAVLAGCGGDGESGTPQDDERIVLSPAEEGADGGHTHAPGQGHGGTTLGDGTAPSAGGYTIADVTLPQRAGRPDELTFRILDEQGRALTEYAEEQTKLLHLYVVRNDLADFRHLHPTMAEDGTWTARVNLSTPGSYRVVSEFTPGSESGGDHVVVGRNELVPGSWQPAPVSDTATGGDGVVEVAAPEAMQAGPDGEMTITVSDGAGGSLALGTYLGVDAHLTGFHVETGEFVHAHPFGEPEETADGTELNFHTEFDQPGRYRFFTQVRVDGFVHTVPIAATVG